MWAKVGLQRNTHESPRGVGRATARARPGWASWILEDPSPRQHRVRGRRRAAIATRPSIARAAPPRSSPDVPGTLQPHAFFGASGAGAEAPASIGFEAVSSPALSACAVVMHRPLSEHVVFCGHDLSAPHRWRTRSRCPASVFTPGACSSAPISMHSATGRHTSPPGQGAVSSHTVGSHHVCPPSDFGVDPSGHSSCARAVPAAPSTTDATTSRRPT